jgi:nucleotide-binding universal stress UspA family protein
MEFHTKIILHPTDFSDNSAKALQAAVDFLSIPKTKLVVLHVSESPTLLNNPSAVDIENEERERKVVATLAMEKYLKSCFGNNEPIPVPEREILSHSSVYKGILDNIGKISPYMVVIGQKGTSKLPHLLMGSTTKHLVEKSTCPILVVPSNLQE